MFTQTQPSKRGLILISFLLLTLLLLTPKGFSEERIWISIDKDAYAALNAIKARALPIPRSILSQKDINPNIIIAEVDASRISQLSSYMHQNHRRCAGFMAHNSLEEAYKALRTPIKPQKRQKLIQPSYRHREIVLSLSSQLEENNIIDFIKTLSAFDDRYFQTESGEMAAKTIADHWQTFADQKDYISVEQISHSWAQPSVIMTIKGSELPEEYIVVGGHLDSINQWLPGFADAPGADDDASGISTLTEVARVMMSSNFRPKRSIQFMGYAAEEVGLKGSQDIAEQYRRQNRKVQAVLQLDMTNYQGSAEDIAFISDYTDSHLNQIAKTLLDKYFPEITYTEDYCGYACSDHASWTKNDYPAIMPFEARMKDMNPHIHTTKDTLDKSGHTATHALKFAKLALAFLVETANAP